MPLPLALFASSYNEDDESGTTILQNSKASYIPAKNDKNNYMLDGNGKSDNNNKPKNKNPSNMRKTIKQKPSAPNESKLSALLKSMDESSDSENENENENDDNRRNLVNYKGVSENSSSSSPSMFPPLPELNYKGPSMMQSQSQSATSSSPPSQTQPVYHTPDIPTSTTGAVSNSSYDNIPSTYANQYYKQFVPYMNQSSTEMPEQPKSELIEKLNYIIDILEEQQDYKTNSIFEDLILYAFLGIFVIFIVDSFSRSGKYVR
jgi:hypothetical protein